MSGAAGWEQGLKKDAANTVNRAAGSTNRAAARMHANAGQFEPSAEPLVCPKCRTHHDTGLYCVHCDVELVGESFVDVAQPRRRPGGLGWSWIIALLIFTNLFLAFAPEGPGGLIPKTLFGLPIIGIHMLIGTLILALLTIRLVTRIVTRDPEPATAGHALLDKVLRGRRNHGYRAGASLLALLRREAGPVVTPGGLDYADCDAGRIALASP